MAVLGELGRGTTPRFLLKTTCSTGDIAALEMTLKSGAVTLVKTLKAFAAYAWYPYTGVTGIDAATGHLYIKWLPEKLTVDADLSDIPNDYIGVYAGTATTAPTVYTDYTWYQFESSSGAHVYIKWAAAQPDSDDDMKTTPDAWIGICRTDSATAPTAHTAYSWQLYTGETGAGASSDYIYTKWLPSRPMQNSDLSDTPNNYIGVYVSATEATPNYDDYTWYEYQGIPGFSDYVHITWAAAEPTADTDLSDITSAWIGIHAGPNEAAPSTIVIDNEHQLHIDLTQAETLLLSDEITYQYHYRLAAEGGGTEGFTNSSRIYRRTVRELLSGKAI